MPGCRHDRAPSRGQSRKPVRPSGMTKPSAWRAFLRPAAYRHSGTLPAWRKASRTAPKHPPFLVRAGANLTESPERHPPSLPEHPRDGASRTVCQTRWPPAPSGQKSLRNGQAAGQLPCFLPRRPLPGAPTLPSLPVALNTALCTDSVPPCGVPCRQPNQSVCPTGSASSSQEGPFPSFQSYSSAPEASTREKERKKTLRPSSLPASPLLSGRMACLISNSRQTATGTFAPT